MTLVNIAAGLGSSAVLFYLLAAILAIAAADTIYNTAEAKYRRLGWWSLAIAVILTLSAIWLMVAEAGVS